MLRPRVQKQTNWFEFAKREIGVKEIQGRGSNPRIELYHQTTNVGKSDDSVPWCSSFVNFCITSCGYKGTNDALARSWLRWGKKLARPTIGCVVVLQSGTKSWQGHVGFYAGEGSSDSHIKVLGGNQSDEVSIVEYHVNRVLGYRVDKSMKTSKVVIGNTIGGVGTTVVGDSLTGGNLKELIKSIVETKEVIIDQTDKIVNTMSSPQTDNTFLWVAIIMIAIPQMFSVYDRFMKNKEYGV